MAERVAVCAVAQTQFESNLWYKRFQEMCFDVVKEIVDKTGLTFDDETGLRNVVTCSDDVFDARTISDNAIQDAVGAHFKGEEKSAMDGLNAVGYALACVLSGHDDFILVVGHSKESQAESRNQCTNLAFDPFYCRPLGLDYQNMAALQAREYIARAGITDEQLAAVVVQSRLNASKNPLANARTLVSVEDVLNSPLVCDPLRELHIYPVSDGAIAMLLARESVAARFTDNPVWITGFANCMDSYFPGDRKLAGNFSLKKAAARAFKMAGVKDPKNEFDIIEANAAYAHQVPLWIEGLGVCEENAGGKWIDAGGMEKNKVNLSGGMLAGNPLMIGGLARALEAVLQLKGDAGERQIEGAKKALAHGTTGAAGQHQSVMVLEKD